MKGRPTTDAIFIVRHVQEKYLAKNRRKLCHVLVDLEKVYDRMSRKVIEWALRKHGVTCACQGHNVNA